MILKKTTAVVLCLLLLLLLCGCDKKAEPLYEETNDNITVDSLYEYIFTDESYILCTWHNKTDGYIQFPSYFELQKLSGDTWYVVADKGEHDFSSEYGHGIEANIDSLARYDINYFADSLDDGATYRISTYCFDEDGNYYQIYCEFRCSNSLAENEMAGLVDATIKSSSDAG